ncbi:hypothetical protein OnM2_051021 [Erysiphe neolycopersici]|uniref:Clr5 domain-containing protein n=1 Tax=Erysiphe neolycopersici TaxID=212602 RepID=A0A420HSL0_9PEZI|nr:hypothetical protein OnM2_051021 [Erysiphe neolycopersici]
MISGKVSLEIGDKEVSSSCCPKTTLISESKEIRPNYRRRQNNFLKKKIPKKYQYSIEFWHGAMENPMVKPVERIIIESFFIEDRTWKEVQEIFLHKTGVFNSTAALQMKINRLLKKMKSKSISKSRITTPPVSENLLSNEPRDILHNIFGQQIISKECQTQFNILQNRMSCNWDQSLGQEVLSLWPYTSNNSCEQGLAWDCGYRPQLGWNDFDETLNRVPCIQLNDCNKISLPDISCCLQPGDNSGTEFHYESQPTNYLTENIGYTGIYYSADQWTGTFYKG